MNESKYLWMILVDSDYVKRLIIDTYKKDLCNGSYGMSYGEPINNGMKGYLYDWYVKRGYVSSNKKVIYFETTHHRRNEISKALNLQMIKGPEKNKCWYLRP